VFGQNLQKSLVRSTTLLSLIDLHFKIVFTDPDHTGLSSVRGHVNSDKHTLRTRAGLAREIKSGHTPVLGRIVLMPSYRVGLFNLGFLSWLNDLFGSSEEYGTPSVTLTGQSVRSRSEKMIADYLTRNSIAYSYEATAMTNDWFIFKSKISRPDFFLPQHKLVIEYWGLVDYQTRDYGKNTSGQ